MNPFAQQIQLNLNTGEQQRVNATGVTNAKQYFSSLNSLNTSAHLYGVVYLATRKALAQLSEDTK